jgi:putative transcriptional regulator
MSETKIAPGFLVAAPQLKDPNFEDTVILMLEHDDEEGALGLVVNRVAPIDLDMVLAEMKIKSANAIEIGEHPPLLYGGPVAPERGWILHTPDWSGPETRPVGEGMSVTASLDILDAVVSGEGPAKYRFCLGYSGWGPHQLVEEIKAGAWINVPFCDDLIFDVPLDEIWATALKRLGIDPHKLASTIGDA